MQLLLTGGSGFVGKALKDSIAKNRNWNHRVYDTQTEAEVDLSHRNFSRRLPSRNWDTVIHLAQSRNYRSFPKMAKDIFQVNIAATFELADWARNNHVKRFIFASSGSVYKPSASFSKKVESDQSEPESMYAASKLASEQILRAYSSFFEVVILRMFTIYGPGQKDKLIANIINNVIDGKELEFAEANVYYLTPLYVSDCAEIIIRLISKKQPQAYNVYNACGDEVVSLDNIAKMVASISGNEPRIRSTPATQEYLCGDNTNIKKYYKQFVPIEVGLAYTAASAREKDNN